MCKHLFYLFFLFGFLALSAQEKDTLADRSNMEVQELIRKNLRFDPKTAINYSYYLLKRGKNTDDYVAMALAYHMMGESYRVLGDLNLALDKQLVAKDFISKIDDPTLEVGIHNSLGNIYSDLGQYDKVLPSYFEAIRISEFNGLSKTTVYIKHNSVYFKNHIGAYDEALEILNENRDIINENNLDIYINDILRGMVLIKLNQPDSVIFYATKTLKEAKARNDLFSESAIYEFLGVAYA